jgi:catechol 2,3-dioxygenase-like lactoylglutathione lyase family enzyme
VPIVARPDHVAIAVEDHTAALPRWRDELGGGLVSRFHNRGVFRGVQLRYANTAKLEILMPSEKDDDPDSFLRGFLRRFGTRVHHVTLKVADVRDAAATLGAEGFDVVDLDTSNDTWHEAFLRPSQVGGIVVQIAWSGQTDDEWAATVGIDPAPAAPGAASLEGPTLRSPDLDTAAKVWTALGGDVEQAYGALTVRWPDAPLTVRVEAGSEPEAVGLRFTGTEPLPADPASGPAVLAG